MPTYYGHNSKKIGNEKWIFRTKNYTSLDEVRRVTLSNIKSHKVRSANIVELGKQRPIGIIYYVYVKNIDRMKAIYVNLRADSVNYLDTDGKIVSGKIHVDLDGLKNDEWIITRE